MNYIKSFFDFNQSKHIDEAYQLREYKFADNVEALESALTYFNIKFKTSFSAKDFVISETDARNRYIIMNIKDISNRNLSKLISSYEWSKNSFADYDSLQIHINNQPITSYPFTSNYSVSFYKYKDEGKNMPKSTQILYKFPTDWEDEKNNM